MGYPDKAIEFIVNKTNVGEIPYPTLSAKNQGTCGDIMILHLKIEQDIITDAKYDYIGCAGLQAAASALTEMIIGISLRSAQKIESQDILTYLGGLPEQKHECAQLASNTLKKGLETFYAQN
jgi:nitrogen fixation NifU-like protein